MSVMEQPSEIVECGDFILRRWRGQSDLARAGKLIEESLEHLRPWMPWVEQHGEDNTRGFLETSDAKWASGEAYNYAIVKDGALIGMCQAYRGTEPEGWGLGYWLHPAATGQGIATRATAAMVTEMFALSDVAYLEISHDLSNVPSSAVPRRLGFTEIRQEPATPPAAPAGSGIELVWRLSRPAPSLPSTNGSPAPVAPPEVLAARGASFRLHEHPGVVESSQVCATLGVPLERTVKTLAFVTPDDLLLLAALPGHARLRYGALARAAGIRRDDLSPADADRLARAGMRPGGVCPVSADRAAVVVFDETMTALGRVHCGSGRPDSSIEIDAAELMSAVPAAVTAPIADIPENGPA